MENQIPKTYMGNIIKIKYELPEQAKDLDMDDVSKTAIKIAHRVCEYNNWTSKNHAIRYVSGCFSYKIYGEFTLIFDGI